MHVAVVVPWLAGCPHRERALEWVLARYAEHHPAWPVVVATSDTSPDAGGGRRLYVKAAAVNPAVAATSCDVVVVADADVWCDGLAPAVGALERGRRWAVPHARVHRLTQDATGQLLEATRRAELEHQLETCERPYVGIPGGGVVVLPRDLALEVPLDPRFMGWGGEDQSWGIALTTLAGLPWRGSAPLLHLWHPPQPRRSRRVGNAANERLRRRYAAARRSRRRMAQLIEEVTPCRSPTC